MVDVRANEQGGYDIKVIAKKDTPHTEYEKRKLYTDATLRSMYFICTNEDQIDPDSNDFYFGLDDVDHLPEEEDIDSDFLLWLLRLITKQNTWKNLIKKFVFFKFFFRKGDSIYHLNLQYRTHVKQIMKIEQLNQIKLVKKPSRNFKTTSKKPTDLELQFL